MILWTSSFRRSWTADGDAWRERRQGWAVSRCFPCGLSYVDQSPWDAVVWTTGACLTPPPPPSTETPWRLPPPPCDKNTITQWEIDEWEEDKYRNFVKGQRQITSAASPRTIFWLVVCVEHRRSHVYVVRPDSLDSIKLIYSWSLTLCLVTEPWLTFILLPKSGSIAVRGDGAKDHIAASKGSFHYFYFVRQVIGAHPRAHARTHTNTAFIQFYMVMLPPQRPTGATFLFLLLPLLLLLDRKG